MACWHGHLPHMTDEQLNEAMYAYYQAAYRSAWTQGDAFVNLEWHRAGPAKPPEKCEPRRSSLQQARPADKVDAVDVEFVRVR